MKKITVFFFGIIKKRVIILTNVITLLKDITMIRTQIQLTPEQSKGLKKMAKKENKSVAELIRQSVDKLITSNGIIDDALQRKKALEAIGKLHGPEDLSEKHDDYLAE